MSDVSYVLISACRNEGAFIGGLLDTIAAQTTPTVRWIIVDDGSTDDTYRKASARGKTLDYLQTVTMPGGRLRSFASQVYAAQHGYGLVRNLQFSFIGFLDADIRVQPDYYEQLMKRFESDPKLGLAGGTVVDKYPDRIEHSRRGSEDFHVAGGVQFFRRECFERIGGYVPIEGGGQDTIADVMIMMHGWRVRAFPELEALHLRPEGFGKAGALRRGLRWGRKFYLLGYHPLFYLGQCLRRLGQRPVVVASLFQMLGFVAATIRGENRPVTKDFILFQRKLQMRRAWKAIGLQ
jgi:glycosyltransferase involved in cell wall biosynthesis